MYRVLDLMRCMCCIGVFFFKQKTAYELRISDWSSDVCSSDLQWTSGQVISNLFDLDLIPVARDFEYNGQYNILFIRKKLLSNREVRRNMEYFYSRLAKK